MEHFCNTIIVNFMKYFEDCIAGLCYYYHLNCTIFVSNDSFAFIFERLPIADYELRENC